MTTRATTTKPATNPIPGTIMTALRTPQMMRTPATATNLTLTASMMMMTMRKMMMTTRLQERCCQQGEYAE
jgi:hypothetical protein